MVAWARENAAASGLSGAPIRWIIDDCAKFVEREIKRGRRYDAVIMDPPSYGRGPSGEIWKLEKDLFPFLKLVSGVLSEESAVFHHQFLHDRPRAVRSDMPPRQRGNAALRRRDGLG